MISPGEGRVLRIVEAARRIGDPDDPLGAEARRLLPGGTGLSVEGVELALRECLETHPSPAELNLLLSSVPEAPRAHVLLSAGVFTGALRAIALALAASAHVFVRPSRRDSLMPDLLSRAAPGLFSLVSRLAPAPSDHVWAYGADSTMRALQEGLPQGVVLHAHGSGIGVVAIDASSAGDEDLRRAAWDLSSDVVPFDQRGCLSPRLVLALGERTGIERFASLVSEALEEQQRAVPLGLLNAEERAAVVRYRDVARFLGQVLPAGKGWIGVDVGGGAPLVPPPGRNIHIVRVDPDGLELEAVARPLELAVASVAAVGPQDLHERVRIAFPEARASALGRMQRPPFDGPVDRRAWHRLD